MKQLAVYINLILMVLLAHNVYAQDNDKLADKAYRNKAYSKYISFYANKNFGKLDDKALHKLGDSYRKLGDSQGAEKVYALLAKRKGADPLDHFYYAQALQENEKYVEARQHYKICDDELRKAANGADYDKRAEKGWRSTFIVDKMKAIGKVQIGAAAGINNEKYDFCPMYYQDNLIFVSNRTKDKTPLKDRWLGDSYMDLYQAKINDDGSLGNVEPFSKALNSKYHEGPVTFTQNEGRIYFTRSNFTEGKRGKSKDGTTKLKIYTAEKGGEDWINIEELAFNTDEYDYCHPALSANDQILVFASNMKGGYGRMDLYACYWEGGSWSTPINLGPDINTSGDEVFPFIHEDGTLFYSSDGGLGLGGLDVFMATQINNQPDSLWEYAYNVGAPLNSSKDDFGFILKNDEKSGYLSSDRAGTMGEDDIFAFEIPAGFDDVKPLPLLPIQFCIYDNNTGKRIEGAHLTIRRVSAYAHNISAKQKNELGEIDGKTMILTLTPTGQLDASEADLYAVYPVDSTTTNEQGLIKYKLRAGDNYVIEIVKEGYRTTLEYFTMIREKDKIDEYCMGLNSTGVSEWIVAENEEGVPEITIGEDLEPIPVTEINPNVEFPKGKPFLVGAVLNKEYQKPLPNAKVIVLNRCTGEETLQTVGKEGRFSFPLECGCEYIIKGRKSRFIADSKVVSLLEGNNCTSVRMELMLTPGFDRLGEPLEIAGNILTESLKEGDVIELKNIYYDYDESFIRKDASKDLDELVKLMQMFPSMEIELSSHTDKRGSEEYNRRLSDDRAKSAKVYLVEKGIDANRIKAVGYGESRPKVKCDDCTTYQHQMNRRTEFLVTKFDQLEYYQVIYTDNKPSVID